MDSNPSYDQLKRELDDQFDSLYAEFGDDVTKADVEEVVNDVFYGLTSE